MAGDNAEQVEQHDRSIGVLFETQRYRADSCTRNRRSRSRWSRNAGGRCSTSLNATVACRWLRWPRSSACRSTRFAVICATSTTVAWSNAVRGGAVRRLPAPTARERLQSVSTGQVAVARALAGRLQVRGGVIVLDNGSTSTLVAQHLTGRERLTVVTGNPAAASEAWNNGVEVILLGGVVDVPLGGVIDASAVEALRTVRADVAVLGVCAIDDDGVTTDVVAEVALKRAMVASAAEVRIPPPTTRSASVARTSWPTWMTSTCWNQRQRRCRRRACCAMT